MTVAYITSLHCTVIYIDATHHCTYSAVFNIQLFKIFTCVYI